MLLSKDLSKPLARRFRIYTAVWVLTAIALGPLILTAIVISMGGTAFVLSVLYLIAARYSASDMDEIDKLKH